MAPNSPVCHTEAALAQQPDEALVQRHRDFGARGVDEARPAPLCRVAVQRELADDEHRAVDVGKPEVHLAVASANRRRPADLVGHPRELVAAASVCVNPTSSRNPAPIEPVARPSTRTSARETRWSSTRMTA